MNSLILLFLLLIIILILNSPKRSIKETYCNKCNIFHKYNDACRAWDYEYPLADKIISDKCKLKGLIDDYDTNNLACYFGYYVPSTLNFSFY